MKTAKRQFVACALVSCLIAATAIAQSPSQGEAKHVVVVVFDGLRPDSINLQDTPTLYALSQRGTTFAHHHPVYLSSTEVNGTAIATGAYPSHDGIMGNREYRPGIELSFPIGTEQLAAVQKGDLISSGQYLKMPTIAELVQRNGMRSVVAGTKPVALLLDRKQHDNDEAGSVNVFQAKSLPMDLASDLAKSQGPFPKVADPKVDANAQQDAWTARVLVNRLWASGVPEFTTLWLSEPDFAQHGSGPGSEVAKAALKSSDNNLAIVLSSLEAKHCLDTTDVFVVSDHGFSTISRNVVVSELLRKNGFNASEHWSQPQKGDVLVVGNGGEVSLYVEGHDEAVISRLVEFLQQSDFAGAIFSRKPVDGTFDLSLAKIDTHEAPDIAVSMRWFDGKSKTGMAGLLYSEGSQRGPGQGNHASLSKYDMHNTLIAAGPDIRHAFVNEMPSGNADIAPTVLWILGITPPQKQDGRVLFEAFSKDHPPAPASATKKFAAVRNIGSGRWEQYLSTTQVGEECYLDEGNGRWSPTVTEAKE